MKGSLSGLRLTPRGRAVVDAITALFWLPIILASVIGWALLMSAVIGW